MFLDTTTLLDWNKTEEVCHLLLFCNDHCFQKTNSNRLGLLRRRPKEPTLQVWGLRLSNFSYFSYFSSLVCSLARLPCLQPSGFLWPKVKKHIVLRITEKLTLRNHRGWLCHQAQKGEQKREREKDVPLRKKRNSHSHTVWLQYQDDTSGSAQLDQNLLGVPPWGLELSFNPQLLLSGIPLKATASTYFYPWLHMNKRSVLQIYAAILHRSGWILQLPLPTLWLPILSH